jgi:hypothetical protein
MTQPMLEEADHGPKSYRSPWQCSGRKSFISCVREVLMTHNGNGRPFAQRVVWG